MKHINEFLTRYFGTVYNVDTTKIIVLVEEEELLDSLKVNDIVILIGSNADEHLIGIITKVSKKKINIDEEEQGESEYSENYCSIALVGTFYNKIGVNKFNVFKRAISTYPEINSFAYKADENALEIIMNSLSNFENKELQLKIGRYACNKDVDAILDGNKFFQRHACIVGSTGSGKSYTVASMLERINKLEFSNTIVFDLHGEYNELSYADQIKIGSNANDMKIPLWFFNYEELHSLFIESSEGTSSNQRAAVVNYILESKKKYIDDNFKDINSEVVTADTPVPFSVNSLKQYLNNLNIEEIDTGEVFKSGAKEGQPKTKQGPYYDKLTNLITRLQTKIDDKKYGFVFDETNTQSHTYLNEFVHKLMGNNKKVKVLDLSEVPSDILPIIIGIVTRLIYDVQFWTNSDKNQQRHPLVFVCDEAHIYMPNDTTKLKAVEKKSLEIFEKISKEGRKYGIGLLIISQRPSELNTTVVSQCNNIISLKVTNDRDKSAVKSMLTDSLVGISDMLSYLDVGECITIGDAVMLPTKILLDEPNEKPKSSTIDFWDRWIDNKDTVRNIDEGIKNLINQYR